MIPFCLRALLALLLVNSIYQVCSSLIFHVGIEPCCELRNCTTALEPKRVRLGVGTRLEFRFGFEFESALVLLRLFVVVVIVFVVVVVVGMSVVILVVGNGQALLLLVGFGELEYWTVE